MNTNTATYCPEDNKLRLYVGRVPRDEYETLRREGWTSTPKQTCDFVAHWTPGRVARCLTYADLIEDEDAGPDERAADRAERFGGYLEKRSGEALGHADRYDAGPQAHGFQNAQRAERAAARHDRIADRAGDAWSKADYWQRRTAGVISHALHVSSPSVRMGRIKTLEADQRKHVAEFEKRAQNWRNWQKLAAIADAEQQTKSVLAYVGSTHQWAEYMHPRAEQQSNAYRKENALSLYSLMTGDDPITGAEACAFFFSDHREPASENAWSRHYALRLAYENQMLEAQGGRAAFVEMEVGGFIGKHQIRKVNKSPATGRVVSVTLRIEGNRWGNAAKPGEYYTRAFNVERLPSDAYTPPTDADKAALVEKKQAEKSAAPKLLPCPLVNPTDADAERLQQIWNADSEGKRWDKETPTVLRLTQAQYSANSKGAHARAEAKDIAAGGLPPKSVDGRDLEPAACKVRANYRRVIILTDKPQKALPSEVFIDPRPAQLSIVQDQFDDLREICKLVSGSYKGLRDILTEEQRELFRLARLVGYAYYSSLSQNGLTEKAHDFMRSREEVAA